MSSSEHGDWASDTTNPYAAPRASIPKAVVKPKLEALIAKRLLEAHDRGGLTVALSLRWHAVRYIVLSIYFLAAFALLIFVEFWVGFYLMLGMFFGILLRDLGWFRSSAKVWPFNERVIDWEKVRQIAEGQE